MVSLVLIKKDDIVDFEPPEKSELHKKYVNHVYNQRNIQMCESCAWISFIEYMRQIEGFTFKRFSIFYLYYYARIADDKKGKNAPITTRSILTSLPEGVPPDEYWPFDFTLCDKEPPLDVVLEAKRRVHPAVFEKIEISLETIRYVLGTCGKPLVCNIRITRQNLNANQRNIIKDIPGDLKIHCVLLVGYDDREECFIFQNSFGSSWGFSGFGKLHYSFIDRMSNCYTMTSACIKADFHFETEEESLSFLICTVSHFVLQGGMYQEGELLNCHAEDKEFL